MNWFDKWLKVLRDPNSKKAIGVLESMENPNARCCLGHLCHVLGVERKVKKGRVWYGSEDTVLDDTAILATGLTCEGEFRPSDKLLTKHKLRFMTSLVSLNDDTHLSPAQIADVIEDLDKEGAFHKCLSLSS